MFAESEVWMLAGFSLWSKWHVYWCLLRARVGTLGDSSAEPVLNGVNGVEMTSPFVQKGIPVIPCLPSGRTSSKSSDHPGRPAASSPPDDLLVKHRATNGGAVLPGFIFPARTPRV